MTNEPTNIYEAEGNKLSQETQRLSNFDLPNQLSVDVIGTLVPGALFLDVGAGPSTSLLEYVQSNGGKYTALDKNPHFLEIQKNAGAKIANGDVRRLPFEDASFDVTHTRFVIAHLGADKQKGIREVLRVTKSGGRAIIMDYDWTTARGSEVFAKVKSFFINGGFLFDADFGAELESQVRSAGQYGEVSVKLSEPTFMTDYSNLLRMREAGTIDLTQQGNNDGVKEWNKILDELQKEADSTEPPGFYFPGIRVVILQKD